MFKEIALTFYLCKLFILLDHQQFLIPVKGKTKSSRVLYPLENYYIQPFKAMDPAQLRLYGTLCVLVFKCKVCRPIFGVFTLKTQL